MCMNIHVVCSLHIHIFYINMYESWTLQCNTPQHIAKQYHTAVRCVATHLEHTHDAAYPTATRCNTLQHTATQLEHTHDAAYPTATHCNTHNALQHILSIRMPRLVPGPRIYPNCNTPQHTATCCNTTCNTLCKILQHTLSMSARHILSYCITLQHITFHFHTL